MIELIKHAIKLNKENRDRLEKEGLFPISLEVVNKEFRTIHVNIGRRTGKTRAMMTLARKDDLIIVHSEFHKSTIRRDYPNCLATIITPSMLSGFSPSYVYWAKDKFDYVWFDEPKLITRSNSGYNHGMIFSSINANLFIKLGE